MCEFFPCFWCKVYIFLPSPRSWRFYTLIFSETFKAFCVIFKPVTHFELIVVEWDTGQDPFFFPLPMNANYSNTICWKRYIFPTPWRVLQLCQKSVVHFGSLLGFTVLFHSVQFSCSVMSDSLRPHEPQHARPPCPSPTPGVHPDSHPSSQRCHPAISSSVVPFSSCPQSLPASGSFPMNTGH